MKIGRNIKVSIFSIIFILLGSGVYACPEVGTLSLASRWASGNVDSHAADPCATEGRDSSHSLCYQPFHGRLAYPSGAFTFSAFDTVRQVANQLVGPAEFLCDTGVLAVLPESIPKPTLNILHSVLRI
ncbi:MAG: hypothetical protein HY695_08730 [Deltaproteobacteria bacterium]|nr:hypothetical protein [Deltaproteobacteria bacterium]